MGPMLSRASSSSLCIQYEKVSVLTMGYPVIIYFHYKITEMLKNSRFVLTQAHSLQYFTYLFRHDLKKMHISQSSRTVVILVWRKTTWVCGLTFSKVRPNLEFVPLDAPSVIYFMDGSCFKDHTGNHAGYAGIQKEQDESFPVVKFKKCLQPCSAQLAE